MSVYTQIGIAWPRPVPWLTSDQGTNVIGETNRNQDHEEIEILRFLNEKWHPILVIVWVPCALVARIGEEHRSDETV